jgi:hypothetical protein
VHMMSSPWQSPQQQLQHSSSLTLCYEGYRHFIHAGFSNSPEFFFLL